MNGRLRQLAIIIVAIFLAGCAHRAPGTSPRLKELDQRIASTPEDAGAWVDRGYVYCLLGERASANADFAQALRRQPDDALLRSRVGWGLFNLGDARGALRQWQEAVRISRGRHYYDDYILAVGYWGVGERIRASEYYDQAVKRDERFGEWSTLVPRTETWTAKEKEAIAAVFDLWRKVYKVE